MTHVKKYESEGGALQVDELPMNYLPKCHQMRRGIDCEVKHMSQKKENPTTCHYLSLLTTT